MKSAFHPDALTVDTRSPTGEKYLGTWRWNRDGDFAALWAAANDAARTAAGFFSDRETLDGDEHLSTLGRSERLREKAKASLREFGAAQRRLNAALAEVSDRRQRLAAVPPVPAGVDGLAERLLDIELARALREMPADDRQEFAGGMLSGSHQRVIESVLRLPAIVSGLTENMHTLIENAAIRREHPDALMKAEALTEAASMAQHVLSKSASLMLEGAGLDLAEQLQAVAGNWRGVIPATGADDAMDAIARRHASTPEAA